MKSLTTAEIRQRFLDFFAARGHKRLPSSPLVPKNDPTLLFVNAGMVQFKDVFTGAEKRDYTRATTAQKCVRAGGKHNDLENVGYTPRHHTFFEMLGNFSFGDYFKKEAIEFAWELITKEWKLDPNRLCVTIFKGEDGVPADEEAAAYWKAVGVPEDRIFRLGKKDNFWQMGDTGPQGPCSEIHYFLPEDTTDMFAPGRVENSDGWLEIWNLVFMQFAKNTADGPLVKLPAPSVDTGAGLERVAMVMQGETSTYHIDSFLSLLEKIASRVGKTYGRGDSEDEVSMRVVADHARATVFLVADNVQPSNDGRGYVLRRIMRRAIRHGARIGYDDLFFHRVCLDVVEAMKDAYPQLVDAASLIEKVAENEEKSFRRTLDRGLRLLQDEMNRSSDKKITSAFVAELYDTYGFPIDLTRVIANENDRTVDEDEAAAEVKRRQEKGSQGGLGSGTAVDKVWFTVRDDVGATIFAGYDQDEVDAKVAAIVKDGQRIETANPGDKVSVVLDRTALYGESGGQVGDSGTLTFEGGAATVDGSKKPVPELIVHELIVDRGVLKTGAAVRVSVDAGLRNQTRRNHSATHLLHLALKEVLGDHVQQKGSLVAPDRLRFDFSHFEPLTSKETAAIESRVNEMILSNAETTTKVGTMEDAQNEGAVMLFGEKYGDEVRMIRIGGDSIELCGGTHVTRAGDIGMFKLVSDSNIASGVRRVEAVTGLNALAWVQKQEQNLERASQVLKTSPDQIAERIEKLLKKNKELERSLDEARTAAAMGGNGGGDPLAGIEEIDGIRVLFKRADGTPKKSLRGLADQLRDKLESGVVVLSACDDDRAALLVAATKDLAGKKVHAGNVVKAASAAMSGSGGGRPDFAQGGGAATELDAALARAREVLAGQA